MATSPRAGRSMRPDRVDFHRTKYGPEILIDIAWVHDMPTFIRPRPHWLSFYDILLVTRGRGAFVLDGHRHRLSPGLVLFTTPGQVRDWDVTGLDGLCLFFPTAFLDEFFSDRDFLGRLPYFHVRSEDGSVQLTPWRALRLRRQLIQMRAELRDWRDDTGHLLRASLYDALLRLARDYSTARGGAPVHATNRLVDRYRQLVVRQAAKRHTVSAHAQELGVSVGHLNLLCKRHVGMSAKEILQQELEVAARRLLLYSDASTGQVATELGFRDPSYFSRFFRRRTGVSPARYRAAAVRGPEER